MYVVLCIEECHISTQSNMHCLSVARINRVLSSLIHTNTDKYKHRNIPPPNKSSVPVCAGQSRFRVMIKQKKIIGYYIKHNGITSGHPIIYCPFRENADYRQFCEKKSILFQSLSLLSRGPDNKRTKEKQFNLKERKNCEKQTFFFQKNSSVNFFSKRFKVCNLYSLSTFPLLDLKKFHHHHTPTPVYSLLKSTKNCIL